MISMDILRSCIQSINLKKELNKKAKKKKKKKMLHIYVIHEPVMIAQTLRRN